jgi:ornithine cyclodeaminase/alanine dehydrogenase-like protein (mu-crystallin family)
MDELIPAMSQALADLSSKRRSSRCVWCCPLLSIKASFGVMPAYNGALGAKIVSFYPENRDVHTHHALIVLFHPETGEPAVVMDGRLITEMRTAAVSAVATDMLALPDASVLRYHRFGCAGPKPSGSPPHSQKFC